MEWVDTMAWIVWLVLAAALGVVEFFTLSLIFGMLAAAALVAALTAGLGAPVLVQVLAFAAAAVAGLLVVRPIARRHLAHPPLTREGSDALIGRTGVVLQQVTAMQGLVKLAGEEWSARSYDEHQVIEAGTMVDVLEIDGATAVVYPRELLP